jgi:hypothetical protein
VPKKTERTTSAGNPSPQSGDVAASGKVLPQQAFFLQVKLLFAKARIFLHVLLLFGPTFVSAWLVGRRPTLWLAILCPITIELAQIGFGYQFDWLDLLDLATDAIGIAAGLCLADWLKTRFRRH